MQIIRLLSFLLIISVYSCTKNPNKPDSSSNIDGMFTGTFKRYNAGLDKTANVEINFNKGNFSGSSQFQHYPAIQHGKFTVTESYLLQFENSAAWTADFDWTLILDGDYLLHQSGDSLTFTKSYGNGAVDVYKLAKK